MGAFFGAAALVARFAAAASLAGRAWPRGALRSRPGSRASGRTRRPAAIWCRCARGVRRSRAAPQARRPPSRAVWRRPSAIPRLRPGCRQRRVNASSTAPGEGLAHASCSPDARAGPTGRSAADDNRYGDSRRRIQLGYPSWPRQPRLAGHPLNAAVRSRIYAATATSQTRERAKLARRDPGPLHPERNK